MDGGGRGTHFVSIPFIGLNELFQNAIKNACKVPENPRAANAIFGVTPKQSGAPANDETDDENLVAQDKLLTKPFIIPALVGVGLSQHP